jgi:hypothetical protein
MRLFGQTLAFAHSGRTLKNFGWFTRQSAVSPFGITIPTPHHAITPKALSIDMLNTASFFAALNFHRYVVARYFLDRIEEAHHWTPFIVRVFIAYQH